MLLAQRCEDRVHRSVMGASVLCVARPWIQAIVYDSGRSMFQRIKTQI